MTEWLVFQSIHVLPVIGLIWLLAAVLKNKLRPRGSHFLWSLATAAFVIPACWTLPSAPIVPGDAPTLLQQVQQSGYLAFNAPRRMAFDYMDLFFIIWMGGVLLLLGRLIHQRAFYLGLFHTTESFDEPLLPELAKQAGLGRTPRVRIGKQVHSPLIWGFIRPVIYLPADYTTNTDADAKRHILSHELAHARRRDNLWNWLSAAITLVFWFHPLAWLAHIRRRNEAELATDALAIEQLQLAASPTPYGNTLLSMQNYFSPSPVLPGAAGLFERKSLTERRIRMIANYQTSTLSATLCSCLTAVLVLGLSTLSWGEAPGGKSDIEGATDAFLELVDLGKYEETWPMMADVAKAEISKEKWVAALNQALRKDAPKKRSFNKQSPVRGYEVRFYDYVDVLGTLFSEQVTLVQEGGTWKIAGYFVIPNPN